MASPTFKAVGTAVSWSGTTSVSRPTVATGDFMLLAVTVDYGDADLSGTTGWTPIESIDGESLVQSEFRTFSKIAEAGEAASYSLTISGQGGGNNTGKAVIAVWEGNATTSPVDVSAQRIETNGVTNLVFPSIPTTEADTTLIGVATTRQLQSRTYDAASSGMTKRNEAQSIAIFDQAIAASGATGTRTVTISAGADYYSVSFAIKGAGGGGGGGGSTGAAAYYYSQQ